MTINRDPVELAKNTDIFWKPAEKVEADSCDFMINLMSEKSSGDWSTWLEECRERDGRRDDEIAQRSEADAGGKINPLKLFRELAQRVYNLKNNSKNNSTKFNNFQKKSQP